MSAAEGGAPPEAPPEAPPAVEATSTSPPEGAPDEAQTAQQPSAPEGQTGTEAAAPKMVYDRAKLQPKLQKSELSRANYAIHHIFGIDVHRRGNLFFLERHLLVFAAGNAVVLLDTASLKKSYIFGIDGRGVGAIAVNPSRSLIAVGEKGNDPNIYIYGYPGLKVLRILRQGTERSFAALAFNATGEKLASLGGAPDYLLTVWDWEHEAITLHSKAFGQDIFTVRFSPENPGRLVTSGTGHIRFWKMASTFTGLKLQGDIGKFGKVELSDIESFAILPDGKVLSSTESGALLLWEGNFIKLRVVRKGGRLCHDGAIYVVLLERAERRFVTAGHDGWIRWWDFGTIDTVEVDADKSIDCELEPVQEVWVGAGVSIRHMSRWMDWSDPSKDRYVIQDGNGGVWTYDLATHQATQILAVPGGGLAGLDVSPANHFAATAGADGVVRCWDYVARRQLFHQRFEGSASTLRWAPALVCPKTRTVAVGFADGTVRLLYRLPEGWKRLSTLKPHSGCVTAIEYSPAGDLLATGGADRTIFFFQVPLAGSLDTLYKPVGFVGLGRPVTSLAWRGDGRALLFTLADGTVGEADLTGPKALAVDTSKSYEITGLPIRTYAFKPKPQIRKTKTGIAGEAAPGSTDAAAVEASAGSAAAPGQDSAAPAAEAIEDGPLHFTALQARYSPDPSLNGRFYLSLGGDLAGSVYECSFDSEYPLAELPLGKGPRAQQEEGAVPPSALSLRFNVRKDLLVTGSDDGSVSVRPLSSPDFFIRLLQHDGDRGHVVSAVTSHDDCFLLSAGSDGLLVVSNLKKDTLVEEARVRTAAKEAEAAAAVADPDYVFQKEDAEEGSTVVVPGFVHVDSSTTSAQEQVPDAMVSKAEGPDITDPAAYSIQDAKLKTEEDNMRRAAEQKKTEKRRVIAKMREELKQLMDENAAQPAERRIDASEFNIDKEYSALLEKKGQELCEEVRRECEYETELSQRRLEKLRKFFLDDVEVEAIEIRGLKTPSIRVSCFRTTRLSPETQAELAKIHQLLDQESAESDAAGGGRGGRLGGTLHQTLGGESAEGGEVDGVLRTTEGDAHKVSTFEHRKKMRQERKRAMQALLEEKPREDAADPRDVEAIAYAESHMGDYKLKSSPSYEVPEDQRMNAEKKMRQMVLLEESLHNIRMRFNNRVLTLRERKLEVIHNVQKDNKRIREIDVELGQPEASQQLWEPSLIPSEWPESRLFYSKEDLQAFTAEVKQKGLAKARPPVARVLPKEANPLESLNKASSKTDPAAEIAAQACEEVLRLRVARAASEVDVRSQAAAANERMETARRHKELTLLFERQSLVDRVTSSVSSFDEALSELRRERIVYQADLTAAETRMLLLVQELALLRNFEAKDMALALKLNKFQAEKADVVSAINDCQGRLLVKKKEVEGLLQRDAALQREFLELVPPSNPFHPQLFKIFKRRIKRSKKKENDDGTVGEDEDEEEEDDEDFDDEDLDEDEEGQDDTCPLGCDTGLHLRVLQLRERRLDQEEVLQEFQKSMDELKRTNDRHVQRQKQIDKDLVQTSKEIRAFQTEKQVALNQLDMVVPLTLKQILCMDYDTSLEGQWPTTLAVDALLGTHVLMTKKDLHALDQRTKELEAEIKAEKQNFKALHREKGTLEKEKAAKEADISVAQSRCVELQMLKFGQLIDIESLDQVSVSDPEVELKHKIQDIDNHHLKDVKELNKKQEQLRLSLLQATQKNTSLLVEIADLNGKQLMMEKELSSGNRHSVVADTTPVIRVEIEERNRLMALVELQSKELDVLKAEINLLRRKGGPVYANAH